MSISKGNEGFQHSQKKLALRGCPKKQQLCEQDFNFFRELIFGKNQNPNG